MPPPEPTAPHRRVHRIFQLGTTLTGAHRQCRDQYARCNRRLFALTTVIMTRCRRPLKMGQHPAALLTLISIFGHAQAVNQYPLRIHIVSDDGPFFRAVWHEPHPYNIHAPEVAVAAVFPGNKILHHNNNYAKYHLQRDASGGTVLREIAVARPKDTSTLVKLRMPPDNIHPNDLETTHAQPIQPNSQLNTAGWHSSFAFFQEPVSEHKAPYKQAAFDHLQKILHIAHTPEELVGLGRKYPQIFSVLQAGYHYKPALPLAWPLEPVEQQRNGIPPIAWHLWLEKQHVDQLNVLVRKLP